MKAAKRVLSFILENGPCSRSSIIASTGLSSSRVSEVTAQLLKNGVLSESGGSKTQRGRRPALLDLDPGWGLTLGIGLHGGVLSAGIATPRGKALESVSIVAAGAPLLLAARGLSLGLLKNCCLEPSRLLGAGLCAGEDILATLPKNPSLLGHPLFLEDSGAYAEYSLAYLSLPIDPGSLYIYGCARVVRAFIYE